MVCRRQTCILY